MELSIPVNYQFTSNILTADRWLRELDTHTIVSLDFEVAVKYSEEELSTFQSIVDSPTSTNLQKQAAKSKLKATALDHPSHCTVTHLSAAWSESDAYVFVITSPKLLNRIMNWLVTTTTTQVWHNASFDIKHIYHHTGKFPINLEDSQLLAKCILNHVETYKARVGLKELAGHRYGDWGISADNFTLAQMHEPHVIRYAATDACATYWLWNSIQNHLKESSDVPPSADQN